MLSRICSLLRIAPPSVEDEGLLFVSGGTVPTDATAGYQTGCIFQHTDGSAGTALYVNEGDEDSCDFNAVESPGTFSVDDLSDVGAVDYTAGKILVADGDSYAEVAVSGDTTLASSGAVSLNAAHAEQVAYIPVAALTAGSDLAATIQFAHHRAVTLQSIAFIAASDAIGTIDDSNTSVFAVTDGTNAIVTKTYNTGTQPTAPGVNDLGTLDATHKVLTANETVTLAITNGATAATPPGYLRIVYIPTNA